MTEFEFQPPILSYEDINTYAENFLHRHGIDNELPIPIERIVEFELKIDIIPFPNLQRTFDVDGFISGDLKSIYVDDYIYSNRHTRYNFTLAHEVGHYEIHRALIENIRPSSVSEWEDFIDQVDPVTYGWLEYQAYAFAGLVMVPRKFLFDQYSKQIKTIEDKIEIVKSKGLPKDSYQEYVIETISSNLAGNYDVSISVLNWRISKEIQIGKLGVP